MNGPWIETTSGAVNLGAAWEFRVQSTGYVDLYYDRSGYFTTVALPGVGADKEAIEATLRKIVNAYEVAEYL